MDKPKQNGPSLSLTKSLFFLVNSVMESVTLFSFFWQRPESKFPMRSIVLSHGEPPRRLEEKGHHSVVKKKGVRDESLEKSIEDLTKQISQLNVNIDGTLEGRGGEVVPTGTLKVKLKNCIVQISTLLNELEDMKWDDEKKRLTERQLELEKRLNVRSKDKDPKIQTTKSTVTEKTTTLKQSKNEITISNVTTTTTTTTTNLKDLAVQLNADLDPEEENFLASLSLAGNMGKRLKKSAQKYGKISGSKRREREIGNAISPWVAPMGGNDGGPKPKKQKSISKGTGEGFSSNTGEWDQEIARLDVGSLLSKLDDLTNAKSAEEASDNDDEEESASSKETDDPLGLLDKFKSPSVSVPSSKPISKDELLKSLKAMGSGHDDSDTESEVGSDTESSKSEEVKEKEKDKKTVSALAFESQYSEPIISSVSEAPKRKPSKSSHLGKTTPMLIEKKSNSTSTSGIKKKAKVAASLPDPPSSLALFNQPRKSSKGSKISVNSAREKSKENKDDLNHSANSSRRRESTASTTTATTSSSSRPSKKYATVSEKRLSSFEKYGTVSEKRKPKEKETSLRKTSLSMDKSNHSSTSNNNSNSNSNSNNNNDNNSTSTSSKQQKVDLASIATDLFPGGTTFDVLRRLSQFQERREESSESESLMHEKSETESSEVEFDTLNCELIASYSVKEDMNKNGLIRGKKYFKLRTEKGYSKRYQMEDKNFCAFPFMKTKDIGLFCVFDGHAGLECATELTKIFPKVFSTHWNNHNKDRKKLDISQVWLDVYKEVDEQLKRFEDEGSTATTLLVWRAANGKRYLQCANVGDSTAFLLRENRSIPLSQDHKPNTKTERDRIQKLGIPLEAEQTRLNGLAVSRAFGDHFAKSVDCGLIAEPYISGLMELSGKDTRVILASDGLWDVVNPQTAFDMIKSVRDPSISAKKLIQAAMKKCNDNVTVIVINLR